MKMVFDREELESIIKEHLVQEMNIDEEKVQYIIFSGNLGNDLEATVKINTEGTGHPYRLMFSHV